MKVTPEIFFRFLKKGLLTVIATTLFHPVITIFISLNQFENEKGIILFLFLVSLLALLIPFWYICFPLQLGAVAYTYQQYFPLSEIGLQWLRINFEQQSRALIQFLKGDLALFPTSVALLFLLIFIAFSSYLLINQMKPSLAILTCLLSLMILQVFTQYDFFHSIVQVLGSSVIALGISQIPTNKSWKVVFSSFFIVIISSFLFTKAALWSTDNLLFQQRWVEGQARTFKMKLEEDGFWDWIDYYSSGGGLKRMGYSENDSKLGGPLQQTFETVFIAKDDQPHYWLISTKDTYTGNGWEQTENKESIPLSDWFGTPENDQTIRDIEIERSSDFNFYPYSYETFNIKSENEQADLQIEIPSMKISLQRDERPSDIYTLQTLEGSTDLSKLSEVSFSSENLQGMDHNLTLPDSIPERVWDLAESITKDQTTAYEKIRAIEQYLQSDSNLRYSLREAAHVPDGEDYVDHFLFESKVGYCDNFSTSMVVMARMVGIPARWAKGFNSGTARTNTNDDVSYQITNANAHSWPEIYFPGHGWIPFEPTPAFSQPLTNPQIILNETDDLLEQDQILEEREQQQSVSQSSAESIPNPSEIESESIDSELNNTRTEHNQWLQRIIFLVSLFTIVSFIFRKKIVLLLVQKLLRLSFLNTQIKSRWIILLFQMWKPKKKSQTLREYFEQFVTVNTIQKEVFQNFIFLNETFLYASQKEVSLNKENHDQTLFNMVKIFQDLQLLHKKSSY